MSKAQTRKVGDEQEPAFQRLGIFVGKWKMQGDQYATDFGPAAKVIGTQNYEWLPGGKFLIHRLEGSLGDNEMACIELICHDAAGETFAMDTYYNNGMKRTWNLHEQHPGNWLITGDWPHKDYSVKVRCTINFSDDGRSNTAKWESQKDDSTWEMFWDLKAVKAG